MVEDHEIKLKVGAENNLYTSSKDMQKRKKEGKLYCQLKVI
jgi:hypothetical protein